MSKTIALIGVNYFPEDSAIGLYTTEKSEFLSSLGYDVTVITGFPYYPNWKISDSHKNKKRFIRESHADINILRYKQYVPANPTFFRRIVHLVDFTIGSYFNSRKVKKCDIVISIVPFTSSILLGYLMKRRLKAKLWVHVQDFEFDAALQTGVGKRRGGLFGLLFKLEKWLFSKADLASTISVSMHEKLKDKTSANTFLLPNWIDQSKFNDIQGIPHRHMESEKTKILYSGNIGDKQDWDTFIQFCNELDSSNFEVVLVGNGARKDWLLDQLKHCDHLKYYPPVPYEELPSLLHSADIHVLFQKLDVLDTVMPSKVLGMMASGKPSLIIGHPESEVRHIIEDSEGGIYLSSYSDEVMQQLKKLSNNSSQAIQLGENAKTYIVKHFSKTRILADMRAKLEALPE